MSWEGEGGKTLHSTKLIHLGDLPTFSNFYSLVQHFTTGIILAKEATKILKQFQIFPIRQSQKYWFSCNGR